MEVLISGDKYIQIIQSDGTPLTDDAGNFIFSRVSGNLIQLCFSTPFRSRACCVLASMQSKLAGRLPTEHASGAATERDFADSVEQTYKHL